MLVELLFYLVELGPLRGRLYLETKDFLFFHHGRGGRVFISFKCYGLGERQTGAV